MPDRYKDSEAETEADSILKADDISPKTFTEACKADPERVHRLLGKVMLLARRELAENNALRRANAANTNRLELTLSQLSSLEEEMDELREVNVKWKAEAEKRTEMVATYARHQDEMQAEIAALGHQLKTARPRSPSPMSRQFAEHVRARTEGPPKLVTVSPVLDTKCESPVTVVKPQPYGIDPDQSVPTKSDKGTPAPPVFTGMDRDYGYREFSRLLENKLAATTFRSEEDGLRWVLSFLKGSALRLCVSRVPSVMSDDICVHPFADIGSMLKELKKRYSVANSEGDVLEAIRALRQGQNQSFASIYTRFLEYRTQIPSMSDAAEMDFIKHLLNDPYRTILSRQGPCKDPEDMVDRLLHLDHEQKTTRNILPLSSPSSSSNGRRDFKGKNATAAPKIVDSLPEKYRNLPTLTPELRSQLLQDRKCLRCREQGHRMNDPACPLFNITLDRSRPAPAAGRPGNNRSTTTTTTAAYGTVVELPDDSGNDSTTN